MIAISIINYNQYFHFRCESVLGEFLQSIIENPKRVDFNAMVNLLTVHSNSTGKIFISMCMYI